jgi:MoCo/4Fe-4S cofactor protein with predicted Tat translocation signal
MKKVFQHPPEPLNARKYWRSLDELAETPEFRARLEREFPQGAAELEMDGVSRRSFLQLMGASTALAGLTLAGCRRPEKHLVPFTKSVEWAIPGKPLFYATSMPSRRGAIPLIVTTHDGRPTKIEGNPLHPLQSGGTDTFAQASILDLYDPDRSRFFLHRGQKADASEFDTFLGQLAGELKSKNGAGVAFLVEENNSPTRDRLRAQIESKFPLAKWCVYEPLGDDAAHEAAKTAFGDNIRVVPQIDKADVILAIDSDFLGCNEGGIDTVRAFSARRRVEKPGDKMNRLYVVENRLSVTGGMADHRLRCKASQIGVFAQELAREIAKLAKDQALEKIAAALPAPRGAAKFTPAWIEECAKDLSAAGGSSLVLCGARQPAAVQLLVHAINSALGNLGKTVAGVQAGERPLTTGIGIQDLVKEIDGGKIQTLFILGGNPVYNTPTDLDFEKRMRTVPNVVRLGFYVDETSYDYDLATKNGGPNVRWHVPAAHYLETWSDARTADGTYVSVQPMILPLYGGYSELDIFAMLLGQKKPEGPELVKDTFRAIAKPKDFDADWTAFLHNGFLKDSALPARTLFFNAGTATPVIQQGAGAEISDTIEVVLAASANVDDGRYGNNGWLQEMPEPVTKLTWDNAAYVSPKTGETLGLGEYKLRDEIDHRDYELFEISLGGNQKIEIPIVVAPGHADNSITIPLGYGRTILGDVSPAIEVARVATGAGVNAFVLRTTTAPYFALGASVKKTGRTYRLAITQHHWAMEGRALMREGTLERFNHEPTFAQTMAMDAEKPRTGNPSLYSHPPFDLKKNQWGMAIDLNACTGCQACILACQAENNTPIVGKEQVVNGREMHWMRLDRYYSGEIAEPEMVVQPMLCQHCENAPCETVCPVNATVHSDDGLNVMAYNRCIGTRYCANNCPFKVRRFNFFDYHQRPLTPVKLPILGEVAGLKAGPLAPKGSPETLKMQKNPNVTVRMRGVMEKCTFCVQRIQEARIASKVSAGQTDAVKVPTDAFKTACQQACPAEAIVFGDIKDENSKVAKLRKSPRGYRLLEYLNVETRIHYLARLRNPNMKMPGAEKVGIIEGEAEEKPHHA